ncbi:hemin uptake system component [Yersinia pestis KIM10+]|uniref:HmuP n=2 Tax=Yersinia pestis TaxID=632 RepID=Q56988_YERPE|nr:HmuP [Yersinia pestis]AAM84132.1 hemin uptake system component [Yersinia pestis KIM10+]
MDKQLNKVPMLNDEPAAEYSVARKPLSLCLSPANSCWESTA